MSPFSHSKLASAVHGGVSSRLFCSKKDAPTVREILERKNALSVARQSWDGILLPHRRSSWLLPSLSHVTPDYVERILYASLTGDSPEPEYALFELMLQTWPRLVKNVLELRNAVCDLLWNVQNPASLTTAADLATRTRDGMHPDIPALGLGWRSTIARLMDAWFTGLTILEVDWEVRGSASLPQAWLPRQTHHVHPRFYSWHPDSATLHLRLPDSDSLTPIPPHKFIVAMNNVGIGHPSGGALLRPLAWYWCAANFSRDWLLNFAQLFGQPLRWATYDPSDPSVRPRLEELLESMGSAAWAAAPQGVSLELKEPANHGSDNPQNQIISHADTACDLLILGQTLTSEAHDSGSRALGQVHYNVRSDIINAAAAWVAEILNTQLLSSVYHLNLPATAAEESILPFFDPGSKVVQSPSEIASRIKTLLEAGIPLKKDFVHELTETPQPTNGEEVYTAPMPMGNSAMLAKAFEKMPPAAREYYLAKLKESDE